MKIGVVREITDGESRVAAAPQIASKLKAQGMDLVIEAGAGLKAGFDDQSYQSAGAMILPSAESVYSEADIITKVQPPKAEEIDLIKPASFLVCPLYLDKNPNLLELLAKKHTTVFGLDFLPRIARAQSMDILSSMSNLAGYKSVILAANNLKKIFPLLTTAAGTTPPVEVLVIGAGVAGLQAIATAKRLGGVIKAMDTRPIVEEQVNSLGAEFISLETKHEAAEDTGGYAKEQSADFYKKEQEIIAQHISEMDVVITTALIPGKKAPILITKKMVETMKPGSVIVDLAIEQGGNCQYSQKNQIAEVNGVSIIAFSNMPSLLATNASQLFAKNIMSFLIYVGPQITNQQYDMTDEIIKNCLVIKNGEVLR